MTNQNIIGIRFQKIGKIYHFNASKFPEIQVGDFAVVDTSRGRQIGEVAQLVPDPPNPRDGNWKSIIRIANPRDLVIRQIWERKEVEALVNCRAKAADLKMVGVKIVAAEYIKKIGF